ncbi:hypothetical protein ANO11243_093350 [Dothideomycetidae sp. 11243]|nr:hypothetical protein ANO11243_093350 [fungal sp. No.11243]
MHVDCCLAGSAGVGGVVKEEEEGSITFVDQNAVAAEKVRQVRPGRVFPGNTFSAAERTQSVRHETNHDLSLVTTSPRRHSLPAHLTPNPYAAPSLCNPAEKLSLHFLSSWVLATENKESCLGYFHHLPALYFTCVSGHVLRLAVESVVARHVAKRDRQQSFALLSQQLYGKALTKLSEVLHNDLIAREDAVLAAVLLLDTYEVRSDPTPSFTGPRLTLKPQRIFFCTAVHQAPHCHGLISLLRLRARDNLFQNQSSHLWRIAHHRIQVSKLLNIEAPLEESFHWVKILNTSALDLQIAEQGLSVISLNYQARMILESGSTDGADAVLVEMRKLETDMAATALDKIWSMSSVHPEFGNEHQSLLPLTTARETLPVYPGIWAARRWSYHCATRAMLLMMQARLETACDAKSASTMTSTVREAVNRIHALNDSMLGSVPTLLGIIDEQGKGCTDRLATRDIGLMFLQVPLQVVIKNDFSLIRQKREAWEVLRCIESSGLIA